MSKAHIDAVIEDLTRFSKDACEEICDDDADCMSKCRAKDLRDISDMMSRLKPGKTTLDDLQRMVETFKRRRLKG